MRTPVDSRTAALEAQLAEARQQINDLCEIASELQYKRQEIPADLSRDVARWSAIEGDLIEQLDIATGRIDDPSEPTPYGLFDEGVGF